MFHLLAKNEVRNLIPLSCLCLEEARARMRLA